MNIKSLIRALRALGVAGVVMLAVGVFAATAFANGTLNNHQTNVDGLTRQYSVYQPDTCVDKDCPVLYMFHGMGSDSAFASSAYYNWQSTADANDFVVVFPDSLDNLPGKDVVVKVFGMTFYEYKNYDIAGFGDDANTGKRWDVAHIQLPVADRCSASNSKDLAFFDVMVAEVGNGYHTLPSHVYTDGHSYGALFSYYAAMCRPDVITAFGEHSGGLTSIYDWIDQVPSWWGNFIDIENMYFPYPVQSASDIGEMPGILLSSTGDSVVPHFFTTNLNSGLAANGHPHELVVLPGALDHHWDKTKNQYQWNFFMDHSAPLPDEPEPEYQCSDGVDNDGDGLVDMGDPGCENAEDNDEYNEPPEEPVVLEFGDTGFSSLEEDGGVVEGYQVIGESVDPYTFSVTLDGASTATLGVDFDVNLGEVTVQPGAGVPPLEFTVFEDYDLEGDEIVVLKLEAVAGNLEIGNVSTYAYTIEDSTKVIGFTDSGASAPEGTLEYGVTAHLDGKGDNGVKVNVYLKGGNATEGVDFHFDDYVHNLHGNIKTAHSVLGIVGDEEIEPDESVVIGLEVVEGYAVLGGATEFTYVILNDDEPQPVVVEFVNANGGGVEGSFGEVFVKLNEPSDDPVNVLAYVDSGTAIEGADFALGNGLLTFAPGEVSKKVNLTLYADLEVEGAEDIVFGLEIVNGFAVLGDTVVHTYTIDDDTLPPVVVGFDGTYAQSSEGKGSQKVEVHFDGKGADVVTAMVFVKGGTAEKGVDYEFGKGGLMYGDGGVWNAYQEIPLTILNDDMVEGDETIIFGVELLDGHAVLGADIEFTYVILNDDDYQCSDGIDNDGDGLVDMIDPGCENEEDDNEYNDPDPDPVVAEFGDGPEYVFEKDEWMVVPVKIVGESAEPYSVLIYADEAASTATEGEDFELNLGVLTVEPGGEEQVVELLIYPDYDTLEGMETVVLRMEAVDGDVMIGEQSSFSVGISDTTGILVFDEVSGQGSEGKGGLHVGVHLDGKGADQNTKARVFVVGGTAEAGEDFEELDVIVDFADGYYQDVFLDIWDDDSAEDDETIVLVIEVFEGYAVVGEKHNYTHTIMDDDGGLPPPPPEEDVWTPRFFTVLNNSIAVIWRDSLESSGGVNWAMTYDYGQTEPKLYAPFFYGPVEGYDVLDVEVSWKGPYYFWWALWETDGGAGLWRRDSGQNDDLTVLVAFEEEDLLLRDFTLNSAGKPFVLWQTDVGGSAVVSKFNVSGSHIADYELEPPSEETILDDAEWQARQIIMDRYNKARVLWVDAYSGHFVIQTTSLQANSSTYTPVIAPPTGHDVHEFDVGWWSGDQASRVLFVDDEGDAKIWKVSVAGELEDEFSFDSPDGYFAFQIETTSSNRINLLFGKIAENGYEPDNGAIVWNIHATTGVVKYVRSYEMK